MAQPFSKPVYFRLRWYFFFSYSFAINVYNLSIVFLSEVHLQKLDSLISLKNLQYPSVKGYLYLPSFDFNEVLLFHLL